MAGAAGCLNDDSPDGTQTDGVRDSDGDGVIDSQDYAPNDPDVQAKSDVVEAATEAAATTTTSPSTARETTAPPRRTTTSPTRTTSSPSRTTTRPAANTITVTRGMRESESGIVEYSAEDVTARVVSDGPSIDLREGSSVKLLVTAYQFPREDAVTYGVSDAFRLTGTREVSVDVDLPAADPPTGERVHYLAFLLPGGVSVDDASASDLAFFHESDPFVVASDDVTIRRDSHPKAAGDVSGEGYERTSIEGAYRLSFEGETQGNAWSSGFYIYKSTYVERATAPRGRSRPEYVSHAQQEGFADELAQILASDAEKNGFTEKRMQVEFVIDFVQNLPYVPDDVSTGYDDYTKFISETVVEAGGDCEDTAIMLAAVLQADPFNYDMVLIQPPEHMAAGIYGDDDLAGSYYTYEGRRYYYIETTGSGWGIGDSPERYQGESAYIHQV